jgi:hypothetical protein
VKAASGPAPSLVERTELILRIEQRLWRDGSRGVLLTGCSRPGRACPRADSHRDGGSIAV